MSYHYESASELNAKFLAAAAKGDLAEVEACRNRGADPDQARDNDRRTALHLAAHNGHAHVVKYFLEDRADARLLDEFEDTALQLAVRRNDVATVQTYIDCEVSIEPENYASEITPLTTAAEADAAEVMQTLLKGGVKAGRADDKGKTAIMWAAERDSVKAFDVLIEAGADPCAMTRTGKTVLDFAKAANAVNILAKLEPYFPSFAAEMDGKRAAIAAHEAALAQVELTNITMQGMSDGLTNSIGILRPFKLKGPQS